MPCDDPAAITAHADRQHALYAASRPDLIGASEC